MSYALIDNGHFYPGRKNGDVLGIVQHVTAGLQDLDGVNDQSAEGTNRYGATTSTKVSWHVCTDSDSVSPGLPDTYTAWHASGYNSRTYGIETSNVDARWDNKPSAWVTATLRHAARAAAPIVIKYDIPIRRCTRAEVDAAIATNRPFGFVDHSRLSDIRRDPGATFPWVRYLDMVREEVAALKAPTPTTPSPEEDDMSAEDTELLKKIDATLASIVSVGSARYVVDTSRYGHIVGLSQSIAEKVGAPVDVDESAIAAALAPLVAAAVKDTLAEAGVPDGDTLADAVVARLGAKLTQES